MHFFELKNCSKICTFFASNFQTFFVHQSHWYVYFRFKRLQVPKLASLVDFKEILFFFCAKKAQKPTKSILIELLAKLRSLKIFIFLGLKISPKTALFLLQIFKRVSFIKAIGMFVFVLSACKCQKQLPWLILKKYFFSFALRRHRKLQNRS